ncbi:hypothetical protein [Corynebacterium variabile]|uniref:hypothetical protein n=1 Tax=Corynebacterium variabile TaxID=1727 RepID=UPI0011D268D5|nr:hypothetical protein [Corynebacterium variabile]
MTNLITQGAANPVAKSNYILSMDNLIDFHERRSFISESDYEILSAIFPNKVANFWGTRRGSDDGNARKFSDVTPGDITIFARDKTIVAVGRVAHALISPEFANSIWDPDTEGNSWELVCAFDELYKVNIPVVTYNNLFKYKDNNIIQGFDVLPENKSGAFQSFLSLYLQEITPESSNSKILPPASIRPDGLDKAVTAYHRLEQDQLRRTLLDGSSEGTCTLCGKEFPSGFLVAAHIKKRANASNIERHDIPNIAMLACKFGCDELFERGYISVDDGGVLIVRDLDNNHRNLEISRRLDELSGRHLSRDFANPRGHYFEWHRHNTFHKDLI